MKSGFFGMAVVLSIFAGPSDLMARPKKTEPPAEPGRFSIETALEDSQISYRAEGGFTGVESFGVILSCVNGRISVLKSIADPRLGSEGRLRQVASMTPEAYRQLWRQLERLSVMTTPNAPAPRMDILDEFTVRFEVRVGPVTHRFSARGLSRPEAARHFALRSSIDNAAGMAALWQSHSEIASISSPTDPAPLQ